MFYRFSNFLQDRKILIEIRIFLQDSKKIFQRSKKNFQRDSKNKTQKFNCRKKSSHDENLTRCICSKILVESF